MFVFEDIEKRRQNEYIERFGNIALYVYDALIEFENFYCCNYSKYKRYVCNDYFINFKFYKEDEKDFLKLKSILYGLELFDKRIKYIGDTKYYKIIEKETYKVISITIIFNLHDIIMNRCYYLFTEKMAVAINTVSKYLKNSKIKHEKNAYSIFIKQVKYDDNDLKSFLTTLKCFACINSNNNKEIIFRCCNGSCVGN